MDTYTSKKLVKDTFENAFNKDSFIKFARNLLNTFDVSKAFHARGYVQEKYKQVAGIIKTYERIGTYTDPNENKIDILIVYLQKDNSIDRARTTLRNFVADYLKNRDEKEAGLVAFVSPNSQDWRFSFVKMEYHLVESPTGKIKAKEEFTPAKRYSFLVGVNESSHTAQSRLAPILEGEYKPTLEQLEDAFNIEKVTDEFFERYRELFLKVLESLDITVEKDEKIQFDFEQKGVDPVGFSKKLLGQIVFLYFLQKKGWFGVKREQEWGSGPKAFLRELFEEKHGSYKNFFNDILEPLFYNTLAVERPYDLSDKFNCRIPFLNGGLFDPLNSYDWYNTDVFLPNELFSNEVKTKEGDKGTGILDIFDRYNFTVKEDEPLEKEVAVDPEMLGKVFENLLEVKDRKSKGTYYTPREIVHYMCQESLINYLVNECEGKVGRKDIETLIQYGESAVEHDSRVEQEGKETETYSYKLPESIRKNAQLLDDKLKNIRVCDPAIGSGAFPVGMMNEIIRTRNTLTNYLEDKKDRSIYNFKRDAIQNSLYGVDIDPGAVEIAKLRLWLSLVVDEEDIKQIKPLPNLDYKIMQGNSLLEEFEGVRLFDEELISKPSLDDDEYIATLKQRQSDLQHEFIKLYSSGGLNGSKKQELDMELKKVSDSLKRLTRPEKPKSESGNLFDIFSEAKKKAQELKQLHKEFFEASQKTKKDELKRRIEKLEWELIEATLKEQSKISALKQLEQYKRTNVRPFFLWKLHFAEVFQEKGGFDVIIANPPYFVETDNKEAFRILRDSNFGKRFYEGRMDFFHFFIEKAGSALSHAESIITFITTNYWLTSNGAKKLREFVQENIKFIQMLNFNEIKIFETAQGQHNLIFIGKRSNVDGNGNQETEIILIDKLNSGFGDSLRTLNGNYKTVSDGITKYKSLELFDKNGHLIALQTNPFALKIKNKLQDNSIYLNEDDIGNGIDVLQESVTKNHLENHPDFNLGEGIFVLTSQEVSALNLSEQELRVMKPFTSTENLNRYCSLENIDHHLIYADRNFVKNISDYPNLRDHLLRFKSIMTSANKPYGLNRPREEYYFKGDKILVLRMTHEPKFPYVSGDSYISRTFLVIKPRNNGINLKYLSCLFNSKLARFWFYNFGKRKGNLLQIDKEPLLDFPIKRVNQEEEEKCIKLVDKIAQIMKLSNQENIVKYAEIRDYEKQIDQMVYKLYGLTPEEIAVVEVGNEKSSK